MSRTKRKLQRGMFSATDAPEPLPGDDCCFQSLKATWAGNTANTWITGALHPLLHQPCSGSPQGQMGLADLPNAPFLTHSLSRPHGSPSASRTSFCVLRKFPPVPQGPCGLGTVTPHLQVRTLGTERLSQRCGLPAPRRQGWDSELLSTHSPTGNKASAPWGLSLGGDGGEGAKGVP